MNEIAYRTSLIQMINAGIIRDNPTTFQLTKTFSKRLEKTLQKNNYDLNKSLILSLIEHLGSVSEKKLEKYFTIISVALVEKF